MDVSRRGVASYLIVGAIAMATGAAVTWLATRPRLEEAFLKRELDR